MVDFHRVIIVHDLNHARGALQAASELRLPVALQSAPDAIFYAGSLYLLHLYRNAVRDYPQAESCFILDCADTGAEAVEAMRAGHRHIRSSAPAELRAKLHEIASQLETEIVFGPYKALDLRFCTSPTADVTPWLLESFENQSKTGYATANHL